MHGRSPSLLMFFPFFFFNFERVNLFLIFCFANFFFFLQVKVIALYIILKQEKISLGRKCVSNENTGFRIVRLRLEYSFHNTPLTDLL